MLNLLRGKEPPQQDKGNGLIFRLFRSLSIHKELWTKLRRTLVLILIVVPMLSTTFLSMKYGLEVPRSDSWDVLPILLQRQAAGKLSFHDFWTQHNEQRTVFPKLAMYTVARLSRWNFKVHIGFNLVLAGLVLLVLWKLLSITVKEDLRGLMPWLVVVCSWSTFSTVPWENLIWEISGTLFFMSSLAVTFSIWSLARWPWQWKGTVAAALGATVAMYSLGNGILLWVVGFGMLIVARPPRLAHLGLWIAWAGAATGAFFHKFAMPGHHPGLFAFLRHPGTFSQYVSTFMGAPWQHSLSVEAWVGFMGVAFFLGYTVWAWGRGGQVFQKLLPWLAIGWFVLLNALLTGLSRLNFGISHAFGPRYITTTNLFWFSFVILTFFILSYYIKANKNEPIVVKSLYLVGSAFFIIFTLGYADAYDDGIKILRQESQEVSSIYPCVFSGCFSVHCGNVLNIGPGKFQDRIEVLRRLQVGPFRTVVSTRDLKIVPAPNDSPAGQLESASWWRFSPVGEATLMIRGWTNNRINDEPVRRVVVVSNDRLIGHVPVVTNASDATTGQESHGVKTSPWKVCVPQHSLGGKESTIKAYALKGQNKKAVKLQGDQVVPKEP
jgi:hypothetical protein